MKFDEVSLKAMAHQDLPEIDEELALKKVLSHASRISATKDVASLFVGWLWVLFLGFGGSIYSAKRKFDLHHQQRINTSAILPRNKNKTGEEQ